MLLPLPGTIDAPLDSTIVVLGAEVAQLELVDDVDGTSIPLSVTSPNLGYGVDVLTPLSLLPERAYRVRITTDTDAVQDFVFSTGVTATTPNPPAVELVDTEPQVLARPGGCTSSCGDNEHQLLLTLDSTPTEQPLVWLLEVSSASSSEPPIVSKLNALPPDGVLTSLECYRDIPAYFVNQRHFEPGDGVCTRLRYIDGAGRVRETSQVCREARSCEAVQDQDTCDWSLVGGECHEPSQGGLCAATPADRGPSSRTGTPMMVLAVVALCYLRSRRVA